MIEMNCTHVRESAAEFALDILEPAERSAIAAHLLRCPACRREVDVMAGVGTRLLELVPGTEPPLGFDRRVLARMPQPGNRPRAEWRPMAGRNRGAVGRRPRILAVAASAAAAVALVFGSLGWFAGHNTTHTPVKATVTAVFHQGHRSVGTVEVYSSPGRSPWVSMTVQGAGGASEKVTCELIGTNGSHTALGSFDLVDGSGSWGAPDRAGLAGVSGAQLVDGHGQVIATAVFSA